MEELYPAEVAATEAVSFEKASHNHAKSDLIKDRDITRVLWRVFRDAGALDAESIWKVAELEISYSRCDFEAALDRANILIKNSKAPIAMYGRTMRMLIMVANGDADRAYKDFLVLKDICSAGLAQRDDAQLFAASMVCAFRVENVLMSSVFDIPDLSEESDEFPTDLHLYFGYLLSIRFLRLGLFHEAYGSVVAYQNAVGMRYPVAKTYLCCVGASAKMLMGEVENARKLFDKAWELKDKYGILMPFIELNYALLGLPRMNRRVLAAPEEVRRVDAMISSFSKGWFGLRRKCGLSTVTELLTPLETYTSGLAALGWRNKEIAKHLLVSESTVKHQLTSVYQKLHISSRAELRELYQVLSRSDNSSDNSPRVLGSSLLA